MSSEAAKNSWAQARQRYSGLFTSRMAPTSRAYCILMSFFLGVLQVTAGAVFYHVSVTHPGDASVHTPPLPIVVILIVAGVVTLLSTVYVIWRYGMDDGDDSLAEDMDAIAKEDVLDQQHQQLQQHLRHQMTQQPQPQDKNPV